MGKKITTIEGLANGNTVHPVQQAWLDRDVPQCGFCQPGQIMAAVDLLGRTRSPTDADIDAIENMCRCGTYGRIRDAIKAAGQDDAVAARGLRVGVFELLRARQDRRGVAGWRLVPLRHFGVVGNR